jgi:predicted glycoside hydrolase/deacetylase ChbG (UPF0249 family)
VRRLIVNADDFGLTGGVTRGILDALAAGVVRSTSAMLCLEETAAQLRQSRSVLADRVGVHLQLMDGVPCSGPEAVPSLVCADGKFPTSPTAARGISLSEVRREWHAQVERLMSLDFKPTHIDAHNHVHMTPGILEIYCEIALYYGLPARSGTPRVAATLRGRGVACADRCEVGGYDGEITTEAFLDKVARAFDECGDSGVVELMCHPGYADAALAEKSFYVAERERELEVLCAARTREGLDRLKVEVVGWSDV